MKRYRLLLLLVCVALLLGIVHEQAVAEELDAGCASLCELGCATEDGCRLYRHVGCNCKYVCGSGAEGETVCGR